MAQPFSSRRFLLAYTAGAAALVFLFFALFHVPYHQRKTELVHTRLATLTRLLATAYPYHTAETFRRWLDDVRLDQWAAAGWNVAWIGADRQTRWAIHPFRPDELPPAVVEVLEQAQTIPPSPPARLVIRRGLHLETYHILPLSPNDLDAGRILLQAPLPRFFRDAKYLWAGAALLVALLFTIFSLYQRQTRRYLRNLMVGTGLESNLPPLQPDDTLESWTRRYVTSAARKITEERHLFDALFELLQDGILLLDPADHILRANSAAAAMLGRGSGAISGTPLTDIEGSESLSILVDDIRESGLPRSDDIPLPGVTNPCTVSGVPLLLSPANGDGAHLLFVMRDLTQLRRLESAGEEYATNVSHELKTPLTLILGYTETLLGHGDMDPEFRIRSLRTIERHAKRIIRIVDDLLRLAWLRNETGMTGIPRPALDVAAVLDHAVDVCNEWAQNAGIVVETRSAEGLIWNLNSGLIEEAIVNLVKNAILYALTGPVEVQARKNDRGHLEITVRDRGPGLKPEDAKQIFDRFYRADKSRSRSSGGSGLGLPIVQQIVEAHHGTARVETAPGEGCTFILEIPPADEF